MGHKIKDKEERLIKTQVHSCHVKTDIPTARIQSSSTARTFELLLSLWAESISLETDGRVIFLNNLTNSTGATYTLVDELCDWNTLIFHINRVLIISTRKGRKAK